MVVPSLDVPLVTDTASAEQFVRWLVRLVGVGFHPDAPVWSYFDPETLDPVITEGCIVAVTDGLAAARHTLGRERVLDLTLVTLREMVLAPRVPTAVSPTALRSRNPDPDDAAREILTLVRRAVERYAAAAGGRLTPSEALRECHQFLAVFLQRTS
jgi:hypothetical protein